MTNGISTANILVKLDKPFDKIAHGTLLGK